MKLIAELIPATGFKVYAGADISAILTENTIVWACSCNLPANLYGGILADVIFIQRYDVHMPTEYRIPLNSNNQPLKNARGSLNGLGIPVYVGWDKTVDLKPVAYAYNISDISPSATTSNPTPIPILIDQTARDLANSALSRASLAFNQSKSAIDTANTALSKISNIKSVTIDDVWHKINDRLYGLINALEAGNRADALDAKWQDVLFKKSNDWIYGQLRDRGLIK
jgi:hypothetical protein